MGAAVVTTAILTGEQAIVTLVNLIGQIVSAQAARDQATLDILHKQAIAAANAAQPVGGAPAVPVLGQ